MKISNNITKKKILGIVLTSIYILLMLIALFSSNTYMGAIPSILIVVGCALCVIFMLGLRRGNFYYLLIVGMFCISVSAIIIGIQQNDTHISHHIIRTIFEGTVIVLFLK